MKINDNGTEREMTEAEALAHSEWAELKTVEETSQAEAQAAKVAARQAVLNKLGLSADEAAALLG
jgi:hypothetical protein